MWIQRDWIYNDSSYRNLIVNSSFLIKAITIPWQLMLMWLRLFM